MALIKVHGIPLSGATAIVMICLAEKGVPYELIPVELAKGEHKSPSFLSKNVIILHTVWLIPALEDGTITLFESRAITRYVAHKYKGTGTDLLRHDKIEEAAMVGVWTEVESQQFNPPAVKIIYQQFVAPVKGETPNQSIIVESVKKLDQVFDVYEARLSNSKYLACDSFTLADLHHIPYIYYLMKTPWADLITSRAHVKVWWDNIAARPSLLEAAQGIDEFAHFSMNRFQFGSG
ncbi:hypothetical protein MKW94_018056 [Papaver nudicaule]|uniref:glutathione transferase n=1 Tax=Papaver nudicaule TaxID=74823 RepID=A0AA41SIB4_PAPNU|nr:hypothetical protein [Papaver nudicaule]